MIAVLQFRATADVLSNIARAASLVRKAAVNFQANFICLPEAFDYLIDHSMPENERPKPQAITGDRVQAFQLLARELNVWISLGGVHELAENGKQHNSHIILDARGDIRAVYRKIHLFDAKVEGGYVESTTTIPGDGLVIVKDTPVGNVGLSTCYDIRFPSMYTALRDAGADVILAPSSFTRTTGIAHWHSLLKARAIENQVYMAAAAQVGQHNPLRASFGHSLIVDPFGMVSVDLGPEDEDVIGACKVSLDRIRAVREQMPVQEHRRKAEHITTVAIV